MSDELIEASGVEMFHRWALPHEGPSVGVAANTTSYIDCATSILNTFEELSAKPSLNGSGSYQSQLVSGATAHEERVGR
jgi:hypothetical protein